MFPLRDENPSHRLPIFTVGLIALNLAAFFYEFSLGERVELLLFQWGIVPRDFVGGLQAGLPPVWDLVTSMFLHGGIGHILGNMWYLWIFGDNLEDYLGHVGYLFFYLFTGIAAGIAHILLNPDSSVPTIGASGAISGVLGGYVVLYPRIRVKTLLVLGWWIDVVHIPALFFLGIWFVMQLLGGFAGGSAIAFGAHIGGFLAGALLMLLFSRRSNVVADSRYSPRRARRW